MGCPRLLMRLAAVAGLVTGMTFVTQTFANPLAWITFSPAADHADQTQSDLRRRVVDYGGKEQPRTILIDTANTYLYFVVSSGKAIRYAIGVGRDGFTWFGVKIIDRKAVWPDWTPPPDMIARAPYLPRFMAGGEGNPLGARALYLSGSLYRIHGTNVPLTMGRRVTSGCIRMTNEDVVDLYDRVTIGTKVVVLPVMEDRALNDLRW
jgi:lipoprotein-anchoring transpeptidase ErfK/SrfK